MNTSILLNDPINPLQQLLFATREVSNNNCNDLLGLLILDDQRLLFLNDILEGSWVKFVERLPGLATSTIRIEFFLLILFPDLLC